MIGILFILLAMLVVLAIFIGKNVHHTCSVWFFHDFKDMSSVSVILVAFAAGIVFTMLCFFISYLIKKNKKNEPELKKEEKKPVKPVSKPAFSFGKNRKKTASSLAQANEELAKENERLSSELENKSDNSEEKENPTED